MVYSRAKKSSLGFLIRIDFAEQKQNKNQTGLSFSDIIDKALYFSSNTILFHFFSAHVMPSFLLMKNLYTHPNIMSFDHTLQMIKEY